MKLVRVQGHEHLRKDLDSGAILNVDLMAVERHKARAVNLSKEHERDKDIENLKTDMAEIKSLLLQLLKKDN